MFDKVPTYNSLRTLKLQSPMLRGEDVYALQHAMRSLGFTTETDGIFGNDTDRVLRSTQRKLNLVADGQAGPVTHKTIAMVFAEAIANELGIPVEAPEGQLEHESGYFLGRYSPPRPNGSFDAGVAQRNTEHTPAQEGFKPKPSIRALVENTEIHYFIFQGVTPLRRRMALAQGAWNAPAYACYIAREEGATKVTSSMTKAPSLTARQTFETYVQKVSKYLTL